MYSYKKECQKLKQQDTMRGWDQEMVQELDERESGQMVLEKEPFIPDNHFCEQDQDEENQVPGWENH